jgi:hypothetical protein
MGNRFNRSRHRKIPYLSFVVEESPDKDILTLIYETFIGALVQGVKDLNEKNKALESRLAALESK